MTRRIALVLPLLLNGVVGCISELTPTDLIDVDGKGEVTKELPWGPSDDPSIFTADLRYTLLDLPRDGAATTTPWTGSYWPAYQDSINQKWDGDASLSPASKYATAFGVTGVEDAVSRMRGIDAHKSRTACTAENADEVCKAEKGERCSMREGKTDGHCVPTWFGICHAWAPAAIMTAEPKHAVTMNGVEFKVNDIKALVTLVHDKVTNKFVSLRCNKDNGAESGGIEYDQYGRPKNGECIDTNPATLHLLMANYLGIQGQSFVEDRTFDDEVWNQPVRGYRVTMLEERDAVGANALIGATVTGGVTTSVDDTIIAKGAWHHESPIAVTALTKSSIVMKGIGDADLYVQFGNQPTTSSYACRPYGGNSEETCDLDVPEGATELFVSVFGYADSTITLEITTGGSVPSTYLFNDKAVKFYEVKTDLQYIGESDVETDGNLSGEIDRYTFTDRLHYLLEVDADGRLIGGEWLGSSKQHHPDFLWLPTAIGRTSVAEGKILVSKVMDLLQRSLEEGEPGTGEVKELMDTGALGKNEMKHFGPFKVGAGKTLLAETTGTGDIDLYVRRNSAPTSSQYDCRPYKNGSTETCTIEGPGDIYVMIQGYANASTHQLFLRWTEPSADDDVVTPPPSEPSAHLDVNGDVTLGAYAHHTLTVIAGTPVMVRTFAGNDVDVYLQMGTNASAENNIAQAYTSSGNETIRFVPSVSGTLHIAVHGYAASSFRLTTANE